MLLGIDLGTSAVKLVLVRNDGAILSSASSPISTHSPRPGWTEQNADDWWAATCAAMDTLRKAGHDLFGVKRVGLSGQMHGAVFLGEAPLRPIAPVLLWNDQRTAAMLPRIHDAAGGESQLIASSGNAARTGFTLPKVLWWREQDPSILDRTYVVLNPKDELRRRLTDVIATDVSDACGTLAFNPMTRTWNHALLDALQLDHGLFAPAFESGEVVGRVTPGAAVATGLREGVEVIAGAGDNMCAAIGAGVTRPGMMLSTIGSSGVVAVHDDEATERGKVSTAIQFMCSATGDETKRGGFLRTGCMLSAGEAFAWAKSLLAPDWTFDRVCDAAAGCVPGAAVTDTPSPLFLPHLSGERCPYPEPEARGAWIGLSGTHSREHLLRSVIEGVCGTMSLIAQAMSAGAPVADSRPIRVNGRGNQHIFWRQLQATMNQCPVETVCPRHRSAAVCASADSHAFGPAYGAAMLAADDRIHTVADEWLAVDSVTMPTCDPAVQAIPSRLRRAWPAIESWIASAATRRDDA